MENKFELISHSHQIADTGDYDGCYEITNGKISIFTKDDDDDALDKVVKSLNESGCKFYKDDSDQNHIDSLKSEIAELKHEIKGLDKLLKTINDLTMPADAKDRA